VKPARKTILCSLFLLLQTWVALAQAATTAQVVVPNALANVEGNSSTSDPFTSSSFRFQQVFDASQFSFLGSTSFARIDSISFRIDGASSDNVLYSFGGASVQLSTTTKSADDLSAVFAENIGADVVTIRNGAISFGGTFQPGSNPQPFGQVIPATTPFFYVPSRGNLLLDITAGGGLVLFPGSLDAQSTPGDSVSRVFANSEIALSGTADSLGLVTRFNLTIIPEPSTSALLILGAGMTMLFLRRKCSDPGPRAPVASASRGPGR
jgi:hypothetical protein